MKKLILILSTCITISCSLIVLAGTDHIATINAVAKATQTATDEYVKQKQINDIQSLNNNSNKKLKQKKSPPGWDRGKKTGWQEGDLPPSQVKKLRRNN